MEQSQELNDNELIYLIGMKNEVAYLMLLNKYSNMIHSIINKYQNSCGYGFNHEDAYATCLDVFENSIINYRVDVKVCFSTYLFHCLNNRMINYQKKIMNQKVKIRSVNYQFDDWEMENVAYKKFDRNVYHQYDPARIINQNSVLEAIAAYIKTMDEKDRELLLLHLDGLKIKDISQIMNLKLRTTGSKLRKIQKKASISLESYKNN